MCVASVVMGPCPSYLPTNPLSAEPMQPRLRPWVTRRAAPLTLAPAAAPTAANDNFVDRTIALWRHRSGREVSREDARQITENVTGFFSILNDWSRGETRAAANDNEQPAAHEEKPHDR